MRIPAKIIITLLTIIITTVNICLSQSFADKKHYLVDSLELDKMNETNRQMLDSVLSLYHKSQVDTVKIQHVADFIGECWDNTVWPVYNRFLYRQAKEKLTNKDLPEKEIFVYKTHMASAINNFGYLESSLGNVEKALKYYGQSLEIREEIGDKNGIGACLNNMANIYGQQGEIDKSLEYYKKSLKVRTEIGNKKGMAKSYNNLAVIYDKKGDHEKSMELHQKSLKLSEELNDMEGVATSFNNIGFIYEKKKEYSKALEYHQKGLKLRIEIGDDSGRSYSLGNIGSVYDHMGNVAMAKENLKESLNIAQACNNPILIRKAAMRLSDIYWGEGKYKESLEHYKLYIQKRDEILNENNRKAALKQNMQYEYEKKHMADSIVHSKAMEIKDISLKQQEAENKKQQVVIYAFIIGFIIIVVFSVFLYRLYLQKKKANVILAQQKLEITRQHDEISIQNEMLAQQNEEITAQRDEIEAKRDTVTRQKEHIEEINKEITDSIQYAKRIQNAILPEIHSGGSFFFDTFIVFRPKDIVSGDFYYMTEVNEWCIIAAADCTGHGVPGAFMSMLGISMLNEIVLMKNIETAAQVLDKLREKIIISLRQMGDDVEEEDKQSFTRVKDGMDMSIIAISKNADKATWAGANNPLYLLRNNDLIEYKGDKMPVSIHVNMDNFKNHEIDLFKGDQLYMFSDGFPDQFGGPKGKKFKYKPFKELLIENSDNKLSDQKDTLEVALNKWMNPDNNDNNQNVSDGYEQVDDITIIGIRI